MATIVTRAGKGSPLTNTEVDANFTNLNTDKAELSGATFTGAITANAGVVVDNFTLDGTTLALSSGDMTLDAAGDIILDADGGDILFKDGGTSFGKVQNSSSNMIIESLAVDKDILFYGNDNSSSVLALTLDMSAAGAATFNAGVTSTGLSINSTSSSAIYLNGNGAGLYFDGTSNNIIGTGNLTLDVAGVIVLDADNAGVIQLKDAGSHYGSFFTSSDSFNIQSNISNGDIIFKGSDGGSGITALTLDMSAAGAATFNSTVNGMTIKASASGDRFGCIPEIASNGVMEIGRYIDFHATDGDTSDYGARLDFDGTSLIIAANTTTTGAATFNSTIAATSATFTASTASMTLTKPDEGNFSLSFDGSNSNIASNSSGATINLQPSSTTRMSLAVGGTLTTFPLADKPAVFNENGVDADFRVESDGNANMLFVDGGENTVGIGTNSTSYKLNIAGDASMIRMQHTGSGTNGFFDISVNSTAASLVANYSSTAIPIQFYTCAVKRLELDVNGGLISTAKVGGHSVFNEDGVDSDFRVESDRNAHALFVEGSSSYVKINTSGVPGSSTKGFLFTDDQLYTSAGSATTQNYQVRFYNGNGLVGAITTDGSATAYLTSSDQRLKENIADADDSGELIDAIQVRKFDWKADGEHQRYGMVAQELDPVAPEAVSGDADSEDMMGVDYSKLVPMLIKEIQSLRQRVAQLEE